MKQLLLPLLLLGGTAFAQTTFVVKDKNNKLSGGTGVYFHNKMIAKTDAEGKATVKAKISSGDSIKFVNSWNFAWYVAEGDHKAPRTIEIRLQPVEMKTSQPPQPPVTPVEPEEKQGEFPFIDNGPVPPHYDKSSHDNEIHEIVDEPAEFPGGKDALDAYLKNKLRYPESAKAKAPGGKCYVKFIVRKDGSIENIMIIRGINDCPDCNKEAIRVVKSMPKWKPARIAQQEVDSYFTLPVNFKFEK